MKKYIVTILLLIAACSCFAQQIIFQKAIAPLPWNAGNYSVKQTADGGYVISGRSDICFECYQYKVSLIKTDANGDTLWTKLYWSGIGNSVQQTSDGGYIVGGWVSSLFVPGFGFGYLIKTDGNGDPLWTRTYDGANDDWIQSVQQTADGGFIMGGRTLSFGPSGKGYLVKTDANGDTLWSKTYSGGVVNLAVQQATDGGYIFTHIWSSLLSLTKTDSSGNISWSKTYDAPGAPGGSSGNSVQPTSDGGFIAIGTAGQSPTSDIFLIKTDSTGNLLWSKIINSGGSDYGETVQQTSDGGYIIGGGTNGFTCLIKTDASGNLVWSWSFSGQASGVRNVRQTADGGYILLGYSVLVKTDSLGNSGCNQFSTVLSTSTPAIIVDSVAITVTAVPTNVNFISYNIGSGGTVTTLCTSVGVENIEIESKLLVYPNPGNGIFNLQLNNKNNEQASITVYDVTGRIVFAKDFGKHGEHFNESIDLSNLFDGVYLMQVATSEHTFSQKVIVQHN